MKIGIISDTHGSAGCWAMAWKNFFCNTDLIFHAGDILYHGPRNPLPDEYAPAEVAAMLNALTVPITAVRGNCDAEVDQMMLDFPIMADFSQIFDGARQFFLTHGHLWNEDNLPNVPEGSVLAHGHTHIPVLHKVNGITVFNPGSISLPKRNLPPTFGFYDGSALLHYDLISGERLEF